MAISGISGGYSSWSPLSAASVQKASTTAIETASDLDKVRDKGLVAFAREAKKDAWEEKLKAWKAEAMKNAGLTEESLAAMTPDQRTAALQQIDEAVKARIKEAMDGAKAQAKNGLAVPNFVDFSV
jgi:cobalamin biosynthesis protein CbiD